MTDELKYVFSKKQILFFFFFFLGGGRDLIRKKQTPKELVKPRTRKIHEKF